MICEHWDIDESIDLDHPDRCGDGLVTTKKNIEAMRKDPSLRWELFGLKYCCTIKGKSWTDIMVKYHKHMDLGPYYPMRKKK